VSTKNPLLQQAASGHKQIFHRGSGGANRLSSANQFSTATSKVTSVSGASTSGVLRSRRRERLAEISNVPSGSLFESMS